MSKTRKTTLTILVALIALTMGFGTVGWMKELPAGEVGIGRLLEAIFLSFLAFGGDPLYRNPGDWTLHIARITGMLTAASVVFAFMMLAVKTSWDRRGILIAHDHTVLVGADSFSLSYAQAREVGKITILAMPNDIPALEPLAEDNRISLVAADLGDVSHWHKLLGAKPKRIIFGGSQAHINAQRAIALNELSDTDQSVAARIAQAKVLLRMDDDALARELEAWSPRLAHCETFSEGGYIAQALLTQVDFCDIAKLRSQDRVHIAIIGMGHVALSLAEEIAQRLHSHAMKERPLISTIDTRADDVDWDIRQDFAGVRNAVDLPKPLNLDACSFGPDLDDPQFETLLKRTEEAPLTAILVCVGDDKISARIGMRLRRAQTESRKLLAPTFVRMRGSGTLGCDQVNDISEGIYVFGGNTVRDQDISLDDMKLRLGKRMHDLWRTTLASSGRQDENIPWDDLTLERKRSNKRAGLAAVDMLRYAGLAAPDGDALSALRILPEAESRMRSNLIELQSLSKAEYNRYRAERFCAGWSYAEHRNDERREHPLLESHYKVTAKERAKDVSNFMAVIKESEIARQRNEHASPWRTVVRVGVMGPLVMSDADDIALKQAAQDILARLPQPLETIHLEVITPNAPGFDRAMAQALLTEWRTRRLHAADMIKMQAGKVSYLHNAALPWPDSKLDEVKNAAIKRTALNRFEAAETALDSALRGRIRTLDILGDIDPLAVTDEQRIGHAIQVASVCDLTVVGLREGSGSITRAALAQMSDGERVKVMEVTLG
ncbi:hypothetical protein C1J03_15695 [Sulfitobacter sp. SK012]|uniref:hypothetical protein n=1 Tax=Sulfitobacter sp. SK012 TaxID=1389005 RepID=UPI000E0C4A68|nr:hypothetical protein [Sulfitobacter sp. SK012]AXI47326.1 hypothetical protein C1J03_15695 [Sulfitobacter sp. SK012]